MALLDSCTEEHALGLCSIPLTVRQQLTTSTSGWGNSTACSDYYRTVAGS
jgi:hypothetical protein